MPYNLPLWVVPKKLDKNKGKAGWRMVIDFHKLNKKTIRDACLLPNIANIIDQLGQLHYFSTFDLANGFHQLPMTDNYKHKTAFTTPQDHYQYVRMPFRLESVLAKFQRLMGRVFKGLQNIEMHVHLDDIIIYAKDLLDHDKKVRLLLNRFSRTKFISQQLKIEFLKQEVLYLGHVISKKRYQTRPF